MIYKKIDLTKHYPNLGFGTLTAFCPRYIKECDPKQKRKTILIIPGGGYGFVSEREGEPIAMRFASYGFNCFILDYPVGTITFPTPLIHSLAALDFIRKHSHKYLVDTKGIFVMGFSAGGHLTGITGLFYKEKEYLDIIGVTKPVKLAGLILAYPVITFTQSTHGGTRANITHGDEVLIEKLSVEKHIEPGYPATYIWTTKGDDCVPPVNSTLFVEAMEKAGNDVVFDLFDNGWHGGSLCNELVFEDPKCVKSFIGTEAWTENARKFILAHKAK